MEVFPIIQPFEKELDNEKFCHLITVNVILIGHVCFINNSMILKYKKVVCIINFVNIYSSFNYYN